MLTIEMVLLVGNEEVKEIKVKAIICFKSGSPHRRAVGKNGPKDLMFVKKVKRLSLRGIW